MKILPCLLALTPLSYARKYCTRIFHSAIVNNQTLYIDGGDQRWITGNDNITIAATRDLQAIDLSKSWSNTDSDLYTTIEKPYNKSNPNDYPTSLIEGASFSNGSDLFFYGGYVSDVGGPSEVPPVETWRYNIHEGKWSRDGFKGSLFKRMSVGLTAQSAVDKMAYYLGGVVVPGGNPAIAGKSGSHTYIAQGLLTLDQQSLQWKNLSSTDMNNYGTVGDGYMDLIESVGDQGVLVSFGGFKRPPGDYLSILTSANRNETHHNSMEYISIYDIANNAWYTQQSTGDIPKWRMSGCSVVVPAPDQSSFSIYMYGGLGINSANSDGSVYVLSIPSFKWIRLDKEKKARIKHKCQLANKHTMLSVGGTVPQDGAEWQPAPVNCDISGQFANGLGIYDLRSHTWLTNYDSSDDDEYTLNSDITDVIGGDKNGHATVTQPDNGFNNTDLEAIFQKRNTRASSSATPSSSSTATSVSSSNNSLSGGAIAGITVGVVAAAAITVAALIAFIIITRKRRRAAQEAANLQEAQNPDDPRGHTHIAPAELNGVPTAHEMGTVANVPEKMAERHGNNNNNDGRGVVAELQGGPTAHELDAVVNVPEKMAESSERIGNNDDSNNASEAVAELDGTGN